MMLRQPRRVRRRQRGQELAHRRRPVGARVAAERRVHPALREEDVAGLLDLPQQLEARRGRTSPTPRRAADGAGSEAVEHPRLAPPVGRRPSATAKKRSRSAGVGRERRHDEREARLAIGVLDARELRRRGSSRQPGTSRTARSSASADVVGLGERQPGDRLGLAPRPRVSHVDASAASSPSLRSAPNHAAFRLVVVARVEPGAQQLLERRRARAGPLGRRQEPPVRAARRSRACAARSARRFRAAAPRSALSTNVAAGDASPSSIASHSVTQRAPRVSGSAMRRQRAAR